MQPPIWKKFVTTSGFGDRNEEGIRAELQQERLAEQSAPKVKAGIGTLQIENNGFIEERDAEEFEDDPVFGRIATESIFKREAKKARDEADAAKLEMDNPNRIVRQRLRPEKREEILNEGKMLQEDNPRHAELKRMLIEDDEITELERKRYEAQQRLQELSSMGVEGFRQRRAEERLAMAQQQEQRLAEQEEVLREREARGLRGSEIEQHEAEKRSVIEQRKIAEDRRTRIATGIIEEKPTEAANVAPTEEDKKLAEWKSMKPDQRLAKKLQDFKLFSGVTQSIGVADQTGITRRADGTWETPAFVRQYDDMATNIVKSGTNLIRGGLDLKGGGNAEETEAMNQALYQFQQENNLSDEEVVSAWNDFTKRNNDNWNEGEKVRTLSDGEIVLNPTQENVLDRDSIMQVIESAPTTPEAKQEAAQNYEYLAKNIAEQRMFAYEAAGLGIESPSEYAARTGKPIAAINTPEFVSEYEREVIDKEPAAKKYGRSLAADIIIGFSQIATQTLGVGAYVTGSKTLADLSAEGSEGAQAINQGKANTGIAGAVVQNAIPILPMVVGAQLIAAGGAAAGVTAGVVGLASRAYSLLAAGAQSLGATYAEQRADGKTHEEASEKATRAGINTALITGIFNLVPGLAGVEKYTGGAKKAVADVTIREILKSTSKKELAKRVYSFTKDKVLAGLGEGAEEGLDTLTNEFINADPDTNLSTAWKNAVESAKVGALIGSAVDVVGSTGFGARQKASAQLANQGQAPIQTEEERKAASIIRDRAADPAVLAQSVSAIREIETALSNDTNLQPQANIAMGALKISSGQQLDELTAAELTALGIDRTGKPLKDAVPMIEMLNGRPVILDAAVQALESIAPSSKGLVAMTEAEARQKFVRNRFTVTSQSGDVVEVEARDEQEATRLGAMQFATGDIVQSVTPIATTAAGAAAQGGANAAGSGATGSAGAGTAGASGSAPAQQQPQAITPEAQKMLADVDAGGVPTIVTGQMEQIAKANGINVTPDMTPQAVIDALRAKQATSTPAKQRPAAAAETPAQKAIRKARKKSKIAGERMQETSDPNVMIEARADGRIIINPEVLNKTAENLGLSGSQAEKWIADAIDEEVRHQVQIDAAREMWQSSGSNETFDQWLVDRYSAIWESEFVAKGKDSIVEQLYGPDLVNMPTWMRAMEGERMLWQKKYRGNPTEVARLWIDLGKETLENVKALLRRLKKMLKDGEISAEFQADIDALELRLKQAETAPAAPTGNIKAGQIVTGKVTSNNPDINGAVMSGTVRQVGSGFILVDTESGAQRMSISDVTEVREVKSDNKPKQDADQNQGEDQITDVSQVDGLRVIEFPVDRLELSQDVPQFKGNADEKGVVEPLEGKYERLGTGPILVWIRSNGKAEVISGRHRFDLAKRTGEKTIPAQVVRESDGFTKAMAMTADAELNIRDGQGEVKDYANYFKATNMERSEAEERGLLSRVKGRSGWTIGTQASEELFTLFANGKINAATADAIASTAPQDASLQSVGIKAALTGASAEMARNTMLAAKLNVAEKQSAGVQGDLFGFDDSAMREMENQAKIASQQQRMIRDQINAVKGATKRPEQAAKLGVDVKDPASTKAKIDELEALLKRWDNWPMHGDLIAITRGQSTAPAEKPESKPKPAEKPAQKPELSQEEKNQQAYTKLKRDVNKARNASDWAKVVSLVDAAESEFFKTGGFPDQWSDFERYREEAQDKISPRSYVEPITKPLIENQGQPKIELTDAEKALGDALDGLFASKLASEAALKASNLQSFSNNIPPDRLGAMIGAASKLIASGVNTPEGMANSIQRLELSAGKIGALRQFSEAIWSAFRMVDTTLTKDVDWGKVYAGLEVPASTPDAKGDQNESTPDQDSTNAAPQENTAPEDRKQAEEQRELEYVKYARGVVQGQGDAKTKYDRLVEVYEAMPALNAKTSTSKINQAFSTPLPLAYAASMMGDTGANLSTYESSGGHSSLLIEVDANNENVTLNELDPRRLERVKTVSDSWKFTNEDATTQVLPEKVMRIAGNPPFGSVTMDDGGKKVFTTEMGETTTIDHAILLQSLANMDENGRAVFIIGGPPPLAKSENGRKEYYSKGAAAKFFAHLYENYGVIDHVTVNGDLYKKQGAGWPVDIIVIQGKAKSKTALPSAKVPKMLNSWGEVFNHSQLNDNERIESRTLTEDEIRANLRNLSNELEGLRGQRNAENDDGPPPIPDGRKDQQQGEGAGIRPGSDEAVSNRPDADTTQDGQPGVDETGVNQRPSGRSGDSNQSDTRANRPSDSSKPVTKFQSKYTPFSKGNTLDTLIPTNMADAVADAFERIKKDVGGDLTELVKSELGYKPGEDINKHFAGEQIDALAAAIWNFQRGGALIVGDQTGIGKGRIAAGLMRYAVNKGLVPVFVTEKPNLLDSMLRGDLVDIEADSIVKPSILLSEMSKFEEGKKRKLPFGKKYFEQVAASGKLGEGANAIFALYSQIQADTDPTVSKETRGQAKRDKMAPQSYWRTAALKKLAPNAVFILDESHNAAGESITGFRMAEILRNSSRVYYSSATSAKRPENMGIYFKTNIGKVTNGSMDQLVEVMQSGGVPAMQLGSYMLARDGQYLRRERSFEGIKFETTITTETADRDIALADNLTYALRQIVKVQERMAQVAEIVNDRVAQTAKASKIPSSNRDKLESGNFSSKVHNVVSQYLLAIKTKAAVAESIKAIREGKKVVVGLSNTMESAIEDLRQFKDNPDTDFTMSYKGLVMRYLDKMRIMKNGDEEFEITDNPDPRYKDYSTQTLFQMAVQKEGRGEDGAVTINSTIVQEIVRRYMWDEYSSAREQVLRADLGDLPLSPIDAMRQAMEEYGVRTGEITGRTTGLDANGEIYERSESDVKLGGVRYRDAFNDEDLDFLVINQSGSTGINLHAGEKMKNKKPRKMIVVQPSLDINVFMQMLGRIHRSGQVVLPEFSLLQTTLPAEFRPAAILAVKMAMLNANTTSNAKSDVSEGNQVTDIFNKYGDQVVYAALERDPDLQNQFAPFGSIFNKIFNDNGGMIPFQEAKRELEGQPDGYIARAITGYLAVLPVEEQQIFWDKITAEYNAMIDYLNEMGQNDLESKALELKAKTISKEVFTGGGQGDSVFEEPSYVETVETAIGKQPVTGQKAVEITKSAQSEMRQIHADYYNSANQKIEERIAQSKAKSVKWSDEKEAKMRGDMIESRNIIANALRMLGAMGTIKREDGSTGLAVIESVKLDPEKPFAPGSQIFTLQVNDGRRTLKISASKIKEAFEPQMPSASEWDNTTFVGSTRSIVTGNLLAAIRKLNGTGQIISYTTDSGQTQMGVLLPAGFTKRAEAEKARTRNLESIDDFMKAFADEAKVYSVNKTVQFVPNLEKGKIEIRVPASRSAGGKYWTLPTLNRLMDSGEFKQISSDMRGTFDQSRLAEVLAVVGEKFVAIEKVESDKDGLDSLQASRLKSTKQSDNSTPLLDLIEEASKRPETAERLREAKVGNMNALRAFKALTAKRGKGIALTAQEEQQLLDAEIALGQIMAFDMDAVKGGPTNTGALTVPAARLARNQSTQQQFNLGSETLDSGQMTLFASNLRQYSNRSKVPMATKGVIFDGGALSEPTTIEIAPFSLKASDLDAWHGTPHKVDRFTTAKIGTGEGAQAYGWGLYFAENRSVADSYRVTKENDDPLKWKFDGKPFDRKDPRHGAVLATGGGSISNEKAIENMRNLIQYQTSESYISELREIIKVLEKNDMPKVQRKGNLYRVTLKVDDDQLLDWDKPLSEQPEVLRMLSKTDWWQYAEDVLDRGTENPTGNKLHRYLSEDSESDEVSNTLLAAGIRGIRYLDGNSRPNPAWPRALEVAKQNLVSAMASKSPRRFAEIEEIKANISDLEEKLKRKGSYNYVIFDENDIEILEENGKSVKASKAIQDSGKSSKSEMTLFASNLGQPTSPFYSQLERAIEAKMPNSANAGQVMQIAMQNAKAEEVKWSGLQQALIGMQDEKGKVAKADVLNHLRNEGAVRFEEFVTDLELKPRLNPGVYVDEKDGEWWIITDIEDEGPFDSREEAQSYMMNPNNGYFTIDYDNAPFESRPTRYAQYVLPGGKNYREVVLAMPLEGEKRTPNQIAQERHGKDFYDLTRDQMEAIQAEIERKVTPTYTSSHFPDVPNYVAHMRLNERTDADGNEGLFIEELQSDRHQEGRKKGYADGESASEFLKRRGYDVSGFSENQVTNEARAMGWSDIPDAPFRTTWPLQLFKRALRDAVASGKEWIGWTTGETQNERFDLSKQVDEIQAKKQLDGQYHIIAIKGRDRVISEIYPVDKLPDVIGKDLTEKILAGSGRTDGIPGFRVYSGNDLKVGGSGMKGFYDRDLKSMIDGYIKVWKDAEGNKPKAYLSSLGGPKMTIKKQGPSWVTLNEDGSVSSAHSTREKAEQRVRDLGGIAVGDVPATPIWRIDITPEMRKGVEAGQALFASNLGGMNPDRVKDLMEMQSEFGNAVRPPNRASFGDEGVRQVVDVFDIEYEERRERQTVEQWRKAGEEKASKNRASLIRNAKLNATNAAGAVPLAPEDVIGTQIVIEQLVQEAGKDFDKLIEAGTVIQAYRKSMSNVARALASGWDRFMKPEERHRRFLANAILTLPPKVASEIDRTLTPEQAETEIRRKITDRVRRIEKALNDIGTTIDEVLTKQVRLSPDKKGILTDITKDLGKIEKEAIKLHSEHVPLAQIMKRTGITESHMKQLAKKSYDEAMARMIEKVRAGMTLENSGLAASNLTQNGQKVLTEEQIIAEAKRLVEIGLGLSPNPHTSSVKSFARRTRPAQKPKQALDGAADRMAKNWVEKLQSTQSGSPKLQPTKKQELSEMIRKHTKAEVANFVEKAMRLGVSEQQARILDIECRNAREKALRLRYENVKSAEFIKWNRPEFQSGLLQYDFDTKDLDEIKMTVATLTDLTKAVGKVQLLEGKKRSEAEALLAKLDSILAKYGTDAIEVANGGKPLESYRFDISDRQHVYIVANAIRAVDSDWIDKGVEYYYFSLLSGIQTAAVNASSLYHGVWDATVGRFSEIVANAFVKNPMNASLGEWRYVARAMAPMISRAKSNFIAAFGAETPFFEQDILGVPADLDAVLEGHGMYHKTAISGRKGRLLRIPSRTLLATDEFVKTINASAEVGAMAYRIARAAGLKAGTPEFEDKIKELVNIPGSMAWRMAAERAYRRTFTNALPGQIDPVTGQTRPVRTIGEVAGMVVAKTQNVLNKKVDSDVAKLGLTLLRMSFFPFIRVPYNITALAMTYTPLSLVDIASLYAISKGIKDPSRKKVAQAEVIERMSRVMQGTVLAGMLWMFGEGDDDDLEKAILVTGSRPYKTTKKGVRETAERLGIGAYSISWPLPNGKRGVFHYGRIEPIATILATTVDTIKEIKLSNRGAKSYGEAATSTMMSFGNQLSDKTFLKGFGDFWKATQGESNMSQFAADKIGVLIPNLIKQSLREIDPVQRASTDDFFTALGYALAPIGQKEAKIDLYGDEIKKRGFSLQRIFDFTDAGTSAVSDVDKMLWRWSQSNPDSEPIPSEPYATYTPQGESKQKKMTDSQARMYREMAGKIFANRVRAMQFNFEKPTEYDIEKVQDIAKEARKAAKNALRYNPNWK